MSLPIVRRLADAELADATPLLVAEGWDFELPELERLQRLGGCVGAFADKRLVAFLSYVDHTPVRWVGNVVVAPEARGSGLGARLLEAATKGAATVGLYSVQKAITLYERAGFKPHGKNAVTLHAPTGAPRAPGRADDLRAADLPGIVNLDHDATGMDRRALIHELIRGYPRTLRVARDGAGHIIGYGVAKTSESVTELGPIVATQPRARDALLDELLACAPPPYDITVLLDSDDVLEALDERGFTPSFETTPMFLGPPPAWRPSLLVAAAGLEKG